MKKIIFIALFILLAVSVFGVETFDVLTSNGYFWVTYFYDGQNQGQTRANWMVADPNIGGGHRTWTPINEHWECLNFIIRRLRPVRGDTYVISIRRPSIDLDTLNFTFVIEFTSSTQYIYWFSRG